MLLSNLTDLLLFLSYIFTNYNLLKGKNSTLDNMFYCEYCLKFKENIKFKIKAEIYEERKNILL